jgi:hypothetical protein
LLSNRPIGSDKPAIVDLAPTALRFFDKPVPNQMRGKAIFDAAGAP